MIIFFGLFIVVGISLATYGFVKLAQYNLADEVEATVVSVDYNNVGLDVTFSFIHNDEHVNTIVHFDNVKYVDGKIPYYIGMETTIKVDEENQILQFGKKDSLLIIAGLVFTAVGAGFLYLFFGKKSGIGDIACDYERAIVQPADNVDYTAVYENEAERLTELPTNSIDRMVGEAGVWKSRISDRFKVFSLWQNILYGSLLFVPMIVLSVLPLFYNKSISLGYVICSIIIWLFVYCIIGMIFKILLSIYYKFLIKFGKFSEQRLATVVCSAFESSGSLQFGTFSRTHTISKKFRVVALIDGKRSVGYVKGAVPPPQGTVLKVLIRPRRLKRWIIDNVNV